MIRRFVLVTLFAIAATPALAQFPPPGIYQCSASDGTLVGTLNLFVAGDYAWTGVNGVDGEGQVSSAGTDVEALSGPLADIHLKGAFRTDDMGETQFMFESDLGRFGCEIPKA
jgi:hypothetical protein